MLEVVKMYLFVENNENFNTIKYNLYITYVYCTYSNALNANC